MVEEQKIAEKKESCYLYMVEEQKFVEKKKKCYLFSFLHGGS